MKVGFRQLRHLRFVTYLLLQKYVRCLVVYRFFLHTCHPILNPLIGWRELQSTNVRHSFFIKPPVVFQLTWYKIRYCKVLPQHSNFSTHNQCGKLEDFRENEFHESHSHGRYEMRQFEENQAWYTTPGSVFLPGLSTGKYILQHDYRKPKYVVVSLVGRYSVVFIF